jgi:mannosyltransferase
MSLSAPARERVIDAVALCAPAAIAAFLFLFELTTRSLWLDESATVAIASQHGGALGSALARDGGNMLGYYALLHVLIGWFGSGAVVLRLPSAIAGIVTVALVGVLARQLWSRSASFAAGILTAVSLSLVYWGQDARGYAITVALVTASFLAWLALLRGGGTGIAYVVLTTGALYTGFAAVLVIPAQLLGLVWHRDRVRPAIAAVGTTLVLCIPLVVLGAERGSSQLFWVPAPSLRTAKQVLQALTSSGLQPGYYTATGDVLLIATLVALALAAWLIVAAARDPGARSLAVLVVAWAVLPTLLALLLSLGGHSIFQARYVLVSLPAVALLLAWTLDSRLPRGLVLGCLLALAGLRAAQLAPSYGVSTEEWRPATTYVAERAHAGDCLAFYPLDARMPFEYYAGHSGKLPPSILPALRWGRVRPFVEEYAALPRAQVASLGARCSRVWLVSSHQGKLGGPPVSAANFRRLLVLRSEVRRAYGRGKLRTLGHASPISVELFTGAA